MSRNVRHRGVSWGVRLTANALRCTFMLVQPRHRLVRKRRPRVFLVGAALDPSGVSTRRIAAEAYAGLSSTRSDWDRVGDDLRFALHTAGGGKRKA